MGAVRHPFLSHPGVIARLATSLGTAAVLGLRLRSLQRIRVEVEGGSGAERVPRAAVRGGAVCVQVPVRASGVRVVDPAFLRAARREGLQVHVWTVTEAPAMRRLLGLGVDGIMTDRIEVLREVLRERGEWAG